MNKKSLILLAAFAIICSACGRNLPKDNWNKDTYTKLSTLLRTQGAKSSEYGAAGRPYAVFDFDNTSIVNDVEISLMIYQFENLRYKIAPENLRSVLSDCLPDIDRPCENGLTMDMLISDLESDYAALYDAFIAVEDTTGLSLEAVKVSDEYADFCAKMSAAYHNVSEFYDYGDQCLWILRLFDGFTYSELSALCKESCAYFTSLEFIEEKTWESPDMGVCGKVVSTRPYGIKVTQEMRHLYGALKAEGFDVYICSASLEAVVEAMACDPAYGFNMDPEHVFGLRLDDDGEHVGAAYDSTYIQTFKQGKTAAIKAYMAPAQGDRDPSLVAGDSNGDANMLCDFEGLGVGLVIDCGNRGRIAELAAAAAAGDPVYAVQSRDLHCGTFVD